MSLASELADPWLNGIMDSPPKTEGALLEGVVAHDVSLSGCGMRLAIFEASSCHFVEPLMTAVSFSCGVGGLVVILAITRCSWGA